MYHTYPSLKYPEDQKRLWERDQPTAPSRWSRPTSVLPARVKLQGNRIDDTTGGNVRRRAAGRPDVHADGHEPRLLAGAVRRPGLDQRREDHGPLSAQGRARGRLGRRHRAAGDRHQEDDHGRRPARDRLHAVGGPRRDGLARDDDRPRHASWWRTARSAATSRTDKFLKRKVADEMRSRPAV